MPPNLVLFTIIFYYYKFCRQIVIMWETNSLTHHLIMLVETKPSSFEMTLKILALIDILIDTHLNN